MASFDEFNGKAPGRIWSAASLSPQRGPERKQPFFIIGRAEGRVFGRNFAGLPVLECSGVRRCKNARVVLPGEDYFRKVFIKHKLCACSPVHRRETHGRL